MRTAIFLIAVSITILVMPMPILAQEELPYPQSLLQDLESKDSSVRLTAVQAIKPYEETISLPRLLDLVQNDPEDNIRLQAAGALWNRRSPKSAKVLELVLLALLRPPQ